MVLVTGATGFVGSYLVRYLLKAGQEVRALRRPASNFSLLGADASKVQWIQADVNDIPSLHNAMQGIEKIYHAAALISFVQRDHKRMLKVNVEGTTNVVNTALDMGIKKLLYFSTVGTLGKAKADAMLDESEENIDSHYDNTYMLSKCLAEMEVWRGMMEGLNAVIINPALILGAGHWNKMGPGMFGWADKGHPFYAIGSTGFVDVRDVAKTAIALMECNAQNERFIVSAENWSFLELSNTMAKYLGRRKRTIAISPRGLLLFANIELWRSRITGTIPFITPENSILFSRNYQYNNEKLKERLGFNYIPIEQTIQETCESFRKSKLERKKYAALSIE